jgi:hypothetical protein
MNSKCSLCGKDFNWKPDEPYCPDCYEKRYVYMVKLSFHIECEDFIDEKQFENEPLVSITKDHLYRKTFEDMKDVTFEEFVKTVPMTTSKITIYKNKKTGEEYINFDGSKLMD